MNAVEIEAAVADLAEQPFAVAEFPFAFLEAFGNKAVTITRLRGANNKSDVPGGVLQRNNIHLAACGPGQVEDTFKALRESPKTTDPRARIQFVLATDGQQVEAEDRASGECLSTDFSALAAHFAFFLPLAGISTVREIKDNPIDVRATGRLNKLYVELLKHNKDWAGDERRHDMNHFMARLIFCFFAEDTDIFEESGVFTRNIDQLSTPDGANLHEVLSTLFRAMDIKREKRDATDLPGWAKRFPYVNGSLFSGSTEVPRFTKTARTYLIRAGELDWKAINPDIFGSMIQAVADDDERGELGMHYTSVPNILKVLNPLFLDDLRKQLEEAGDNARKLLNLRKRMARIRVFDPACGSGNFLVIAYKEMRAIEAIINERRGESNLKSEIPLTNFRGIELRDFAAEVARLALVIAEYQCNVRYRGQKDAIKDVLPLSHDNWITQGNALRLDWLSICPATGTGVRMAADDLFGTPLDQSEIDFENEGGETYICGNPPYVGSSLQSKSQKDDLRSLFSTATTSWKNLDYIAGWFFKAALCAHATTADFAFVSTNSINQGQQAALLWPMLFERGICIHFGHTSFKWSNLAAHNAGVTVVIVGCTTRTRPNAVLFSVDGDGLPVKQSGPTINAYLILGASVIVQPLSRPISERGLMLKGNMPSDGGYLILSPDDRRRMVSEDVRANPFIYRYSGSRELIRSESRYCLWIDDEAVDQANEVRAIRSRLDHVRAFRADAKAPTTRPFAAHPNRFRQIQAVAKNYSIVVPSVSSEARSYLPCGYESAETIVSNLAFALYDAPLWNFALIASRLHLVWIATVCGKLETRYRYSNTIGWNTFPVPTLTEQNKTDLTRCAEDILLAREAHFPATIADLYKPDAMPDNLRRAHERNDEVLERIYIGRRFKNDTERLEKLFELYTRMTADASQARKAH